MNKDFERIVLGSFDVCHKLWISFDRDLRDVISRVVRPKEQNIENVTLRENISNTAGGSAVESRPEESRVPHRHNVLSLLDARVVSSVRESAQILQSGSLVLPVRLKTEHEHVICNFVPSEVSMTMNVVISISSRQVAALCDS